MDLINQIESWDCGIASTAMFVNLSYNETKNKYFPHSNTEISVREIIKTLERDYPNIHRVEYAIPLSTSKLPNYKAILLVPSLNEKLGAHYIYWDGEKVYDPQENNKGKKYYSREDDARIIWIIRDVVL